MRELLHCRKCGATSRPESPGGRTCAFCHSTDVDVYQNFEGPGTAILGRPERSHPMRRTS